MNTPELNRETPQAPQGFRALVKKRMEEVNLSLRTVASETGISPAYLSRLLSGDQEKKETLSVVNCCFSERVSGGLRLRA